MLCNRFSICSTFQRVCVPNNKLLCLFNTFYKNTLFLGNVTDTSLKYTLLMSMWRMSQCVLQPVSLGPRSAFGLVISAFRRVDRAPLMGFLACGVELQASTCPICSHCSSVVLFSPAPSMSPHLADLLRRSLVCNPSRFTCSRIGSSPPV